VPVLEGALERSVALAAAMDSRGYGRQAERSVATRRITTAALMLGLVAFVIGTYGLLDASAPPYLGLPMLIAGFACGVIGFALAGRRSTRTRYRPDPWGWSEWGVTACGLVTAGTLLVAAAAGVTGLTVPVDPPAWPAVPPIAILGILVGVLPAVIAPPLPRSRAAAVVREAVAA